MSYQAKVPIRQVGQKSHTERRVEFTNRRRGFFDYAALLFSKQPRVQTICLCLLGQPHPFTGCSITSSSCGLTVPLQTVGSISVLNCEIPVLSFLSEDYRHLPKMYKRKSKNEYTFLLLALPDFYNGTGPGSTLWTIGIEPLRLEFYITPCIDIDFCPDGT